MLKYDKAVKKLHVLVLWLFSVSILMTLPPIDLEICFTSQMSGIHAARTILSGEVDVQQAAYDIITKVLGSLLDLLNQLKINDKLSIGGINTLKERYI